MMKNGFFLFAFINFFGVLIACGDTTKSKKNTDTAIDSLQLQAEQKILVKQLLPIDTLEYDRRLSMLANADSTGRWPVKQPYPLPGAILPFKRVVAYYGNLYSKRMGILGEFPPKEMLLRLDAEIKKWEEADPETPVQPALHYIAVVAQAAGGRDEKYRARMSNTQIDSVLHVAKQRDAIVFLDIQVALSDIHVELPLLEKYLKLPQVHLGVDPEFSMKTGVRPGTKIGTYDAVEINYCSDYLAKIVRENNLPPKIFVVHRFTKAMVTNSKTIQLHPEVQFVMHMDGWGEPQLKKDSYRAYLYLEPVQFTGFKLFYKNDLKKYPNHLMTPDELLKLKPKPIYIQYQ